MQSVQWYQKIFLVLYFCILPPSALGMMNGDHYILDLEPSNFSSTIYGQKKAFVVEFYGSSCGTCINFGSKYKRIAKTLRSWRPIVTFAALDCQNCLVYCAENGILEVPDVRYFKFSAKNRNDSIRIPTPFIKLTPVTVASLIHKDWLDQKPKGWPNLSTTGNNVSLEYIWNTSRKSVALVGLIVQSNPNGVAWAVMLHFAFSDRVLMFVVSPQHIDIQKLKSSTSKDQDKFYLFERNNTAPVVELSKNVTFDNICEEVRMALKRKGLKSQEDDKLPLELQATTVAVTWNQFEVHIVDILTTIYTILKREVVNRTSFRGDTLTSLKMWMKLLSKHMPFIYPSAGKFCKSLHSWLSKVKEPLKVNLWITNVNRFMNESGHPINFTSKWMACRGSKPLLRDYNCGLWTLLHVLTVSVHTHNRNVNAYEEILEPIHQFILDFLNCPHCKRHFHAHYMETVEKNRTFYSKTENAIMWLWETHNIVNRVLSSLRVEDPAFPKQQFPPQSLCPSCWANNQFVKSEVLKFLLNYYGANNIKNQLIAQNPNGVTTVSSWATKLSAVNSTVLALLLQTFIVICVFAPYLL